MYKIGIIGNGFVGSSVAHGFSSNTGCDVDDVKIYDRRLTLKEIKRNYNATKGRHKN